MAISNKRGAPTASSSRRTTPPSLHGVIEAFRAEQSDKNASLDKASFELLKRLAHSDAAAKAFRHLKRYHATVPGITGVPGMNVVHWCIMALQSVDDCRGFRAELAKAEQLVALADRLDIHVAGQRKVIDPKNMPRLRKLVDQKAIEDLKSLINPISDWIAERRLDSEEIRLRLGASRKRRAGVAAENATIWALAGNILHVTRKPHERQVAQLAGVILQKDISTERVHSVVRSYPPRLAAWRQLLQLRRERA
jgi:hypothetical protein